MCVYMCVYIYIYVHTYLCIICLLKKRTTKAKKGTSFLACGLTVRRARARPPSGEEVSRRPAAASAPLGREAVGAAVSTRDPPEGCAGTYLRAGACRRMRARAAVLGLVRVACALRAHCVRVACALHAHHVRVACALRAHRVRVACALRACCVGVRVA